MSIVVRGLRGVGNMGKDVPSHYGVCIMPISLRKFRAQARVCIRRIFVMMRRVNEENMAGGSQQMRSFQLAFVA
jgi:hypothetical protein